MDRPYLAASLDAIISDDAIVEVECPYAMGDLPISSGSKFKFFEFHNSANHLFTKLKCLLWSDSRAIVPVKRKIMLFVVFIFKDVFVQKIDIEIEYAL